MAARPALSPILRDFALAFALAALALAWPVSACLAAQGPGVCLMGLALPAPLAALYAGHREGARSAAIPAPSTLWRIAAALFPLALAGIAASAWLVLTQSPGLAGSPRIPAAARALADAQALTVLAVVALSALASLLLALRWLVAVGAGLALGPAAEHPHEP